MSSTTTRSERRIGAKPLAIVSWFASAADQRCEVLDREPGHGVVGVDGVVAEGFAEVAFAGPDGLQTTRFSPRSTHSRVRKASWVGRGMELRAGSQASKVLPAGSRARLRPCSMVARSRPSASAINSTRCSSAGSQRCALAVNTTSGSRSLMY